MMYFKALKLITLFMFCFVSSIGQTITLPTLYEKPEERLIRSMVIELPGKPADEIKTLISNWGQTKFVDYGEVVTGESQSQITFVFLLSYSYEAQLGITIDDDYYIRMVVQIKDNKLRALFYDDGNKAYPATQYNGFIAARTWYMDQFFTNGSIENSGRHKVSYRRVLSFGQSFSRFSKSFENQIKEKQSTTINSDW